MMDVTERMLTEILPIGTKAIMDTDPLELRQDADGVQGLFAALGMDGIVRQLLGGADMHPVALAFHMQARFILMQHLRTREGGFDLLLQRRLHTALALAHQEGKQRHRSRDRSGSTSAVPDVRSPRHAWAADQAPG